jgi:hypothetical protein
MITSPDIRLKASGSQITRARQGRFVLCLRIQAPGAGQALAQARHVVTQLRQAAEKADFPDARLEVPDPDTDSGRSASELAIEQKSPREVRLQFTIVLTLHLGEAVGFWRHAAALAHAADFLQGFSQSPHDKGIEIDVQQTCALDEGGTRPEGRGDVTV